MKTISVYSDVIDAGLILPKKQNYTKRDVDSVILDSLFRGPVTLAPKVAAFVVRCSAVFHGTDFSKSVRSIS